MKSRVALAPAVGRSAFEDFGYALGWDLHDVVPAGPDHPYEQIWSIGGSRAAAHYIEDPLIGVSHVLVLGDDAAAVAREIAASLDTVTLADAAGAACRPGDRDERIRAIAYLAAAAPAEADPVALSAFEELLGDPDPEIRQAAVAACTYPSWPELDVFLERARESDPDASLRTAAGQALEAIRRHRDGAGR